MKRIALLLGVALLLGSCAPTYYGTNYRYRNNYRPRVVYPQQQQYRQPLLRQNPYNPYRQNPYQQQQNRWQGNPYGQPMPYFNQWLNQGNYQYYNSPLQFVPPLMGEQGPAWRL